jgi:copper(I)-binding protein
MIHIKHILFLLLFTGVVQGVALAQESAQARIVFKEAEHDFGDVKQGKMLVHSFEFENTGKAPLLIANVRTTCGCTATEWPKTPILPGQKAKITAQFNTEGRVGVQNKVITVVSNAENGHERVIIRTNIIPPSGK